MTPDDFDYFAQPVTPQDPTEPPAQAPSPLPAPSPGASLTVLQLVGILGGVVLLVAVVAVAATTFLRGDAGLDPGSASPDPDPVATATSNASGDPIEDGFGYRVWVRDEEGRAVRWNPCEPIHWVFHAGGDAPAGGIGDLQAAIAQVGSITGIEFVYDGPTDEVPSRARDPYQPDRYGDRWAPVLMAWADPAEISIPVGAHDRGVSVPIAVKPSSGPQVFVSGQIVLNSTRTDIRTGAGDRTDTWIATILHELGHLIGLDHVEDPNQLMFTRPGDGPASFGPGDLAGLRALGAASGCLQTPPAQSLEVSVP